MCPGPEACEHFLGAAQDSPDEEENALNRETACEAMGTRCSRRNRVDPAVAAMAERVERIVAERRAGLSLDEDSLSEWEAEGLIAWYSAEDQFKRSHDRDMRTLYQIMRANAEAGR